MESESLYLMMHDRLLEKIRSGVYPEGSKMPGEMDLTKEYFVSRITAKKALNMLREEGLITRIAGKGSFVAARSDGPEAVSRLRLKNVGAVGVILSNLEESFGSDVLLGIEEAGSAHGYGLMFFRSYNNVERESELIRKLPLMGADGLIIQPVHGQSYNKDIISLQMRGYPLTLVDRGMDKLDISFVGTNNFCAARDAVFRLIDMGHMRLAFFSSPYKDTTTLEQRYNGIIEGFRQKGVPIQLDTWLCGLEDPVARDEKSNRDDLELICEHLRHNPGITCVFASELSVAVNVREACKRIGLRIPEDLSVVCFDRVSTGGETPFFAHILQRQYEMGRSAMDLLVESIGRQPPRKTYLDAEFVNGASLAPPRADVDMYQVH